MYYRIRVLWRAESEFYFHSENTSAEGRPARCEDRDAIDDKLDAIIDADLNCAVINLSNNLLVPYILIVIPKHTWYRATAIHLQTQRGIKRQVRYLHMTTTAEQVAHMLRQPSAPEGVL